MPDSPKPTWQPTREDYNHVLDEQNPWHQTGVVPDAWALPVQRPFAKFLWKRLQMNEPRRFELVFGPRRVGKTTSLYQTVRHLLQAGIAKHRIWWLRLDHPVLMQVPLDRLVRSIVDATHATQASPVFIFLDELTYANDWDLWLKTFYDDKWPLTIAGSSSSTIAMRRRRTESGIGRWEEQYLAPYLFGEYLDLVGHPVAVPVQDRLSATMDSCIESKLDVAGLDEYRRRFLLTGGFPELLIATRNQNVDDQSMLLESQRTLRNDAVERAVYKDIPQAFGVDNPLMLERVLYTLAGQVTGILSPGSICRGLDGLSQPTFDRYLNYLERSFLVFTLTNYSGSEASKQKRGRKLYFVDGAIRNAALQRGLAPLSDAHEMGLLLENLAAGHLQALGHQSQVRIYYWRDGNDEVDLIYDDPQSPLAFEIGLSSTHHHAGLHALAARHPKFRGNCYIVAPNAVARPAAATTDGIGTMPLDLFLLATSAQAAAALQNRF